MSGSVPPRPSDARSSGCAYSYGRTRSATPWWIAPPVSRSSSTTLDSSTAMPASDAS